MQLKLQLFLHFVMVTQSCKEKAKFNRFKRAAALREKRSEAQTKRRKVDDTLVQAERNTTRRSRDAERRTIRRSQVSETDLQKDAQRKRQRRKEANRTRSLAWRIINQYAVPGSIEEEEAVYKVSKDYAEDLQAFETEIWSPLRNKVCGVCGIRNPSHKKIHEDDGFFDLIKCKSSRAIHVA